MSEQQNFSNHTKIVPAFQFLIVPVLVANLMANCYGFYKWFPKTTAGIIVGIIGILVSVALIALALLARLFALGVQDRVIRLEERLRFQQLLPEDLKLRINEFTINQLVSLRFASDAELPELARKVLQEKLNSRKAIKQMIQNWRADYQRI